MAEKNSAKGNSAIDSVMAEPYQSPIFGAITYSDFFNGQTGQYIKSLSSYFTESSFSQAVYSQLRQELASLDEYIKKVDAAIVKSSGVADNSSLHAANSYMDALLNYRIGLEKLNKKASKLLTKENKQGLKADNTVDMNKTDAAGWAESAAQAYVNVAEAYAYISYNSDSFFTKQSYSNKNTAYLKKNAMAYKAAADELKKYVVDYDTAISAVYKYCSTIVDSPKSRYLPADDLARKQAMLREIKADYSGISAQAGREQDMSDPIGSAVSAFKGMNIGGLGVNEEPAKYLPN